MSRLPKGHGPRLRQHARGHWFVRQGRQDIYLSMERDVAVSKYIELFGQPPPSVFEAVDPAQGAALPLESPPLPQPSPRSRLVKDAAEQLYLMVDGQTTGLSQSNIRADLKLFIERFGPRSLHTLQPDDLLDFRRRLLTSGWAVRTVNQRMQAIRRLLRFCWEMGYVPSPFRLGPLKSLPLPPTRSRAWSVDKVRHIISSVAISTPNLAKILLLQFWACLRPFEVARVVYRQGDFEAEGVFVLERSKTDSKTGEHRRVCLSPSAAALLSTITPQCPNGFALRCACRRASRWVGFNFSPHPLRHSAATILVANDVSGELVETALGHVLPRVQRTYRPPPYQRARLALEVLAKLVPAPQVEFVHPQKRQWAERRGRTLP